MKHPFRYRIEGITLGIAIALLRLLPVVAASAFGGALGRVIGPLLPITRVARDNLARALPSMSERERKKTLKAMWNNLGRTFAELAHLDHLWNIRNGRIELVGIEHANAIRDDGKAGLVVSGHLGNWELGPVAINRLGIEGTAVYRSLNNPATDRLIGRIRRRESTDFIPKGPKGAREIFAVLRQGGHIGLLIDQKMNNGIPVPFFGRDAMTAPSIAQLALKYGLPILPLRIERLAGCRFRITFYPAFTPCATGNLAADTQILMEKDRKSVV